MTASILIRYGEIALKGKNRIQFEQQLHRNLLSAVKPFSGEVERLHGRLIVKGPQDNLTNMLTILSKIFGVVSISPVQQVKLDLDTIKKTLLEETGDRLQDQTTFRITARRANKKFPYQSPELNRILGQTVLQAYPALTVNLKNPDLNLAVEIGYKNAYIYLDQRPGPGGLPVGISGKGLLLLSGGIDSPAAGWLTMKRGLRLEALHFHSFPFTSKRSQQKVADLAGKLAIYGGKIVLHLISVTEIQKVLRRDCPEDLGVILLRRMMMRLAERLSRERGLQTLVTGENLGQVASQTLESITVVSRASEMLILRPLIGFDKDEIIKVAKEIDTYDLSILPYEDCCTVFLPKNPVTRPKENTVEYYENNLNLPELLGQAYETLETKIIRRT